METTKQKCKCGFIEARPDLLQPGWRKQSLAKLRLGLNIFTSLRWSGVYCPVQCCWMYRCSSCEIFYCQDKFGINFKSYCQDLCHSFIIICATGGGTYWLPTCRAKGPRGRTLRSVLSAPLPMCLLCLISHKSRSSKRLLT